MTGDAPRYLVIASPCEAISGHALRTGEIALPKGVSRLAMTMYWTKATWDLFRSVPKMTHPGEHHRHAGGVRGGDHLRIAD